jgi:peptide/nickel transport system substrate-binding protein
MLRRTTVLAIALALAAGGAHAQDARTLTVGASSASTGMDPHYHSSNMNNGQLRQVFDLLLDLDTSGRIVPRLAESWRLIDDVTWEFKLREGIRFHDGTPFEAEDIAFTFARIPTIPNSPGPFTPSVRRIKTIEVVDPRSRP